MTEADRGQRLDRFLTHALPEFSRSRLQALIEAGHITRLAATVTDAAGKVKPGEVYRVTVPPVIAAVPQAQTIALDILYEDADLLVLNKQAGMTVHPAPGNPDKTLVNALLAHCGASLSGIGGVARPGIVHRIDKDTSGLLVVAKHDTAHRHLSAQLAARTLSREYLALAWGIPREKQGRVEANIGRSPRNRKKMAVLKSGGRQAATHYYVQEHFAEQVSLLSLKLETGRTHQIRVHMAHLGHPLLGDPAYGGETKQRIAKLEKALGQEAAETVRQFKRQALHAAKIRFIHPTTEMEMAFEALLPDDFAGLLSTLSSRT